MRTRTLPDEQRGIAYEGPDIVTMLRVYGTALEFPLPRDVTRFTLGSSRDNDIAIPTEFLSALHCVLERRGPKLRVHDQNTKNGTFLDERRESVFDLRPGDTFMAASIRFLGMNDEMQAAYPTLVDLLGTEDEHVLHAASSITPSPSDLLVAATKQHNILILGEPGCDHARLAHTIHEVSLLRGRALVEIARPPDDRAQQREIIARAERSTLVIAIVPDAPVMDAAFCSMIFSPSYHIRVIALAPSASKAENVLGTAYVRDMRQVLLQPIARRRGIVPRLLDRMLEDRDAGISVKDMTTANQAALQEYDWPGNFDDLRLAADRITALARVTSLRKGADALGLSPSSLHYWLTGVGISWPLVPDAAGR
ncbi:MAG TPA: FHA domain-containing protein [Polyangiales bacterium]|jgi:hypothetical protein|nr:FHA domain-containing protein [Polyangiales bacterium]